MDTFLLCLRWREITWQIKHIFLSSGAYTQLLFWFFALNYVKKIKIPKDKADVRIPRVTQTSLKCFFKIITFCFYVLFFNIFFTFLKNYFIVVQLQLSAFSPQPSPHPSQTNLPLLLPLSPLVFSKCPL